MFTVLVSSLSIHFPKYNILSAYKHVKIIIIINTNIDNNELHVYMNQSYTITSLVYTPNPVSLKARWCVHRTLTGGEDSPSPPPL